MCNYSVTRAPPPVGSDMFKLVLFSDDNDKEEEEKEEAAGKSSEEYV